MKGLFVSADRDSDGYLSYTEFAKFFEETKMEDAKSKFKVQPSEAKYQITLNNKVQTNIIKYQSR